MRIPQTAERIKEAPAQALRAVFAGVGQVLLIGERVRRRAGGDGQEAGIAPGTDGVAAAAQTEATDGTTEASTVAAEDKTSATKTSAPEASAPKASAPEASAPKASAPKASTAKASAAKASAAKASAAKASTAKASTAKASAPKASTSKASTAKTETPAKTETAAKTETPAADGTASVLPVPHYSELSIASLRARLRGLDIAQVRELIGYERAHEDRENVIAMFERRIAKLEEAGDADAANG